jgi:hypothetical protein
VGRFQVCRVLLICCALHELTAGGQGFRQRSDAAAGGGRPALAMLY